ncbi:MAG: sugar transferase [Bacteroidales bacterium]|nr:sugar transferase [Bacteroidales bacterium]
MKKIPYAHIQYDLEAFDTSSYSEYGSDLGAKIDLSQVQDIDLLKFMTETRDMTLRQKYVWVLKHYPQFSNTSYPIKVTVSNDAKMEVALRGRRKLKMVLMTRPMQNIYHLDRCLSLVNESMEMGGFFFCHARTSALKKQMVYNQHTRVVGRVIYFFQYLWHRVCPKLKYTKNLYFQLAGGYDRNISRVEFLGRLYHAGFDVKHEQFVNGEFFIVATKFRPPIYGDHPTVSPLIKLVRVGKGGKLINVYKFRTMYSYSEYLQPYIYKYQNLDKGGKFAHDYRVNSIGRFMRKVWLDEFPMLLNILKGQMKLVGVRPLSRHYFSLYSPEMQQLRIRTKPGLLPPFYYEDTPPETLEEIQASERKYIEAYLKHPILTDWRYFWGIVRNILFKHRKSK